jgi:hypothetical protein
MMRWLKWISGLFFCLHASGQLYHLESESGYITGGAYSKHFIDAFSFASNPACLGNAMVFQSGLLTERKWMLKELDLQELALSIPLGNGGLGLSLGYSGEADYNEQAMNLAYGKKLGKLQIGVRFNYINIKAAFYQATGFGSSGIGICYQVTDKLLAGWELELPLFGQAGKLNPEKGPQFFKMGFGYESRPDLFISFQVDKKSNLPLNVIGNIEYRYEEQFLFAFGISSLSASPYFKSGWKKNGFSIEIFVSYEQVLGFSPGIALLWESKNKKR